ncbi:MAG: hypothetical protein M3275_15835 [Thermoproteota archaeon]|nr:hypothetical protein [Thermoproteota archaeon]
MDDGHIPETKYGSHKTVLDAIRSRVKKRCLEHALIVFIDGSESGFACLLLSYNRIGSRHVADHDLSVVDDGNNNSRAVPVAAAKKRGGREISGYDDSHNNKKAKGSKKYTPQ